MDTQKSERLMYTASSIIPGGVNSPVRSFKAVGGQPLFVERGEGSHIIDADGNEFIDYVCSWGPLILGHAHPEVLEEVREALVRGTSFGAPTAAEVELARKIVEAMPAVEMVRMVNSGTEAVMSALRLARAFTGRSKVVKCEGCYHGHVDGMLVKAGSGAATLGVPDSPGVPKAYAGETLTAPYNDLEAITGLLESRGSEVAAVIVEPVAGNMGVVAPQPGYLEGLREATSKCGALLVFDEVITGFRVAYGGAQELYGVRPDLTCLGKIIGGGFPVGAYGGRKEIMEMLAPLGPTYQAGTLSGNPVAMTAGAVTLEVLSRRGTYDILEEMGAALQAGLADAAQAAGVPVTINRVGSMLTLFFTDGPVANFADAKRADTTRYARFFHGMLERGLYLPPSQFEAMFLSLAHSGLDVERTADAAAEAMRSL